MISLVRVLEIAPPFMLTSASGTHLHYTLADMRFHYTTKQDRFNYKLPDDQLYYTAKDSGR